mmetsp:Transcript_29522/g.53447  ORF Transcript_29522/g.53447 Transcript_29522/m.53447 type:complete len:101 (+) Transcript_29522:187-489(+)
MADAQATRDARSMEHVIGFCKDVGNDYIQLYVDDGLRDYTELALLLLAAARLRPNQGVGKVVDLVRSRGAKLALGQRRAAMLAPPTPSHPARRRRRRRLL